MKPLLSASLLILGALIAGCSGSSSTAPTGPGVRVINGDITASQAVATAGSIVIASPLLYATSSGTPAHPYSIIPSLTQTLSFASLATPTVPLTTASINLLTSQDVTAVVYNSAAPQFLLMYDSLTIPTASEIRLVNASTATGSVDVFLTPTTGPEVGPFTVVPGGASPLQATPGTGTYTTLATSGTYVLQIFPAGKDTGKPLVQETVELPTAVSWSFYILDPPTGQSTPIVLQLQDNLLHDSAP